MTPLVSIVIPVHNGAAFVGEAVDSAIGQEAARVEVVVVDDGSTDASAEVARRRAATVISRPRRGLAAARNAGVAAATGSLLGFLDADDLLAPTWAATQVAHLEEHPEVGVLLTRCETRVEPGTALPAWVTRDRVFGDLDGVQPTSGLVRREVFERVGPFAEDVVHGVGFDWLTRARAAGELIEVLGDRPLWFRRLHGTNMSEDRETARRDAFATIRRRIRERR